jgi:hypothetical protein
VSSENTYEAQLRHVQDDLFFLLDTWRTLFGADFHRTYQRMPSADSVARPTAAIKQLVSAAKARLNMHNRNGEASLFVRDPREDRLVLVYSTSVSLERGTASPIQVKNHTDHYDRIRRYYFYPLYDRLATTLERQSDKAAEARGLTGWVAVTGHHLVVNGEYGKAGLHSLSHDRPNTLSACQVYGHPKWGHHISEAPIDPERPKRFIAVPVRSSADASTTIGVLRYACPTTGKELSDADLAVLTELASLIAAVIGIDSVIVRASRGAQLTSAKDRLSRTYNFQQFLNFLARSLRSNIASLYLDVGPLLRFGSQLRLVDAFGVRGSVAQQRNEVKDYGAGSKGFTRWLFDEAPDSPTVLTSVHEHDFWAGLNTTLFYGKAFRELLEFEEHGHSTSTPTEVARHYVIKIMGIPLICNGQRIGVLKIELPDTFDDSKHYDEADQQFLVDAATTAGATLGEFRSFLQGEWFSVPENVHAVINVTRMAAELLRTRMISPSEVPVFWDGLLAFVERNAEDVQDEMREAVARLTPQEKAILKESHSWVNSLKGGGAEVARKVVTDLIAKTIVEVART